jgi:hypothetical protein
MGGAGSVVEVDETFIGRKAGVEAKPGWVKHKHTVLTVLGQFDCGGRIFP